jgi:hypothetical protein
MKTSMLEIVRAQRDPHKSFRLASEFTKSLEQDPEYGPKHPQTLSCSDILAGIYHSLGKYTDAEEIRWRALVGREETLGIDHLVTLTCMHNLASTLRCLDKLAEAEALSQRVFEMREKLLGFWHPETTTTANNLALLLSDQAKYEQRNFSDVR